MSGIVGFYSSNKSIEKRHVVNAMITSIKRRAADELRICSSEFIAMADLKSSNVVNVIKKMPVSNESKTLWIVWSGKIFNHTELKHKLNQSGYYLSIYSDEELMLHLFEKYGADSLAMINGQFAFAIWDTIKKELFLARDRVGICPLFYTLNDK